jgi:hypothetical protein
MSGQPPPGDDHDTDRPADHEPATGPQSTDHRSGAAQPATNRSSDQSGIAPLAEVIAELTRENRELAAAAAQWQERARSLGERQFYSFGHWPSMETIAAMQGHPGSTEAIGKLTAICEEAELGTYLVEATAGEAPQVT